MPTPDARLTTSRKPLRLWPGVAAVTLLWLVRFGLPATQPGTAGTAILGSFVGALAVLVWWLFFSRASWSDRLGAILVMVIGVMATSRIVHESIANGLQGMMLPVFALPFLGLALVASAAAGRRLSSGPRRAVMAAAILLACAGFTLVRTGGITGDAESDLHWRWTPTPEDRLLAAGAEMPEAPAVVREGATSGQTAADPVHTPAATAPPKSTAPRRESAADHPRTEEPLPLAPAATAMRAEWPGFRGPLRDGIVRGVRIETDWSATPPVELWRRQVGPGWSSFSVAGDFVYTQEQRGDHELVSCYALSTGKPVWTHRDAVRFWESNGGAGPRATPTLHDGRVYSMGATGILNALDARSGAVIWSRNAAADTGKTVPDWGIASSPLAVDDLVIAAVAGQLAAYDVDTGKPRWTGESGGGGYSSPHLATIDGVRQILLLRGSRTIGVAPTDGTLLWEHSSGQPSVAIVQPALAADHDVLVATGDAMGGLGMRRISVGRGPSGWTVEERWASRGLKPYFNDLVVHNGHAFGFDGSILASIDLEDGERNWKAGRYGHGQLLLLPDQDLLLVLSEDGELALVKAVSEGFSELARVPALNGKTWNHPVLVRDLLLLRNGEEMAAFRVRLANR